MGKVKIHYDDFDGWWRIDTPLKMNRALIEAQRYVWGVINAPGSCLFVMCWRNVTPECFSSIGRYAYERDFWKNGKKYTLKVAWRDTKETAFKVEGVK